MPAVASLAKVVSLGYRHPACRSTAFDSRSVLASPGACRASLSSEASRDRAQQRPERSDRSQRL